MEEWKEYKIGDTSINLIDGDRGKNYPSQNDFSPKGYCLFLNAGNVTKEGFSFETKAFITKEKDNILRNGKLQRNDIVITTRGTVGNVALYNDNVSYEHLRINSGMLIVRGNLDFDPKYLYYYMKSQIFQDQIQQMKSGSAQPQLPKSTVVNMTIRFPSNVLTQQKIAKILSSFDDKIETNRRINEHLEELAQALFKSWFVDFEPFKDGNFVESELGMIPEGWKVGNLGELCVTNKRTYGAKFSSEIAYLDTGSVTRNNIENLQTLDPTKDKIPSRARRAVTEGDIVFSSVRPNQKHYAFLFNPQSNMVVSTGFVVITANWSGYRYFIYQYLIQEEIIAKLQTIAEQSVSTYPSINATDITNLRVVIPTHDVMEKFAGINLSFMNEIDKNQREITHLANLRDTLLPKLMSGEIDANEVTI